MRRGTRHSTLAAFQRFIRRCVEMKRIILAGVAVAVLAIAGAAFAFGPGMGRGFCGAAGDQCVMAGGEMAGSAEAFTNAPCGRRSMERNDGCCGGRNDDAPKYSGRRGACGGDRDARFQDRGGRFEGRRMMGRMGAMAEMPAELKAKMTEMEKARLQLRLAMMDNPVDQAKAREIFGKIQSIRSEMAAWRFEQMLAEQVKEKAAAKQEVPKQAAQTETPSPTPSK